MTQIQALDILKMGRNVFLTGPAGSGKTHVINQYIRYLKDHRISHGVTASTGIAATHMGGITIHSWSGMGIKDSLSEYDLAEIARTERIVQRIKESAVLIIDEVSMLHHYRLDMLDMVIRHVRGSADPFGGMQIILCGDFFQLPPITRIGETDAQFVYRAESWNRGNFTVCYLHEQYRQKDGTITGLLEEIRAGKVSSSMRQRLKDTQKNSGAHDEPTRLYTHNIDVDRINDDELDELGGYEAVYEMSTKGKKHLVETLKRSCLAPDKLRLKKGARVMCVKNNFDAGYVNGTLGVVVSCGWGVDPVIRTGSTPEYPQGRLITIESATWSIEEDGRVLAEISQYPLRLAWAITVHKSQGMSLDAVEVDLSKAFEPGMGYVALSRVRTFDGLSVKGFNEEALRVHPEVLAHDVYLRECSRKAESIMEYTDRSEIEQIQKEFLAWVAPLHSYKKKITSNSGQRRKKKTKKFRTYNTIT